MNEQTGKRWRMAFFVLVGTSAAGVLTAMQPGATRPAILAPAGGVTWVPDSDKFPTMGRLVGVTADGKLIEAERRFSLHNDSWWAWREARQDKP